MIHITDGQTDTILDDITAKYIINNKHHQSLKDSLELFEFSTLSDKEFSQHLGKHNRVIIANEDKGYQEFVIDEVLKDRDITEVYSSASYLLLKKSKVIYPQSLVGQTVSTSVSHAIGGTEWQAGIIQGTGTRTFHIEEHTNPFAFLKRIAKEFDLELRFRIEADGNRITGRYVDLLEKRGEWRGREAEFGKDLIGIQRIEKADPYTALLGLGPIREDGSRLEILVEDMEALARWGRGNQHLIGVYEPQSTDEDMTEERLTTLTRLELDKRIHAHVEYKANIADLENVPGMENKKIRFGDTIKIKDTKFNPPLYVEARVHTQDRDIIDKSKKHVELGDFIEYTEDEVKAIWQSLQKEIRDKITHFDLIEYTYPKDVIDHKDESVYNDGTHYADIVSRTAEENAKEHAEEQANQAEDNAKEYADSKKAEAIEYTNEKRDELLLEMANKAGLEYVDGQLQLKANTETVQGIQSKVGEIESNISALVQDVATKVDGEWVNGQLSTKADADNTYTKIEVDNAVDSRVTKIEYSIDKDGFISRFEESETRITQNENEISLRATKTELDTEKERINNVFSELSIQANQISAKVDQTIYNGKIGEIENDIGALTGDISSISSELSIQAGEIALRATKTEVDNLSGRVSDAESTIVQHANLIESKVSQTAYEADRNGIVSRLTTAESNITQNATEISQRVTQTTFENGLASKENIVFKQNSAPAHANGRLWLNTSVTPNILYRSTGSAWVKATPTTASEVGAYSSGDGTALASRVTTAEATIVNHGNMIQQRVTTTTFNTEIDKKANQTDVNSLTNRVSAAESTITQLSDEVDIRVTKNGVIGAINLTSETFKIDVSKVEITGDVIVENGQLKVKRLEGAEIYGGYFETTGDTSQAKVIIENDWIISKGPDPFFAGYRNEVEIKQGMLSLESIDSNGIIENWSYIHSGGIYFQTGLHDNSPASGLSSDFLTFGTAESPHISLYKQGNHFMISNELGDIRILAGNDFTGQRRNMSLIAENIELVGTTRTTRSDFRNYFRLIRTGGTITTDWEFGLPNGDFVIGQTPLSTLANRHLLIKADTGELIVPRISSGTVTIGNQNSLLWDYPSNTGNQAQISVFNTTNREFIVIRSHNNSLTGGALYLYSQNDTSFAGQARLYASGTERLRAHSTGVTVYGAYNATGTKSAIVDTEDFGRRKLYAVESPDVRFMHVQEVTLAPGEHWIDIEPMFAQTINGYSILPIAQDGGQVRVLERNKNRFKLRIAGGNSVHVACFIYGKRIGFEDVFMEQPDSDEKQEVA